MKNILFVLSLGLLLSFGSCQEDSRVDKSKLKMLNDTYYFDGAKFTGIAYENHANGKVKSEWTLIEGVLNGPSSSLYSDGNVGENIYWKDGFQDGPYEKYYDNG